LAAYRRRLFWRIEEADSLYQPTDDDHAHIVEELAAWDRLVARLRGGELQATGFVGVVVLPLDAEIWGRLQPIRKFGPTPHDASAQLSDGTEIHGIRVRRAAAISESVADTGKVVDVADAVVVRAARPTPLRADVEARIREMALGSGTADAFQKRLEKEGVYVERPRVRDVVSDARGHPGRGRPPKIGQP
jgi:hypothetical protein